MKRIEILVPAWIVGLSAGVAVAQPPDPLGPPAPPAPPRVAQMDGPGRAFTVQLRRERADDKVEAEGTAWIGVQLGPVPAAVASHLGIDDKGLMVRNVFLGSPADQAGIERYDVILRADDKDVVGTVEAFSRMVRDRKVGDTLRLTLIRGGKEVAQEITLSEAPPADELEFKFEEEPDVFHRRDFGLRGRIFRPGPDGWVMEDLGELPDIERMLRDRGRDAERLLRDPRARPASPFHARRIGKDGETIDVRRQPDGTIEVRREQRTTTGPAGENAQRSEVVTYPNMEELRKGDPEAAELLSERGEGRGGRGGREAGDRDRGPERRRALPPSDPRWREWRERFFQGPFERPAPPPAPPGVDDAPPVRFEVEPDGSITVHKRGRGAELSKTYSNREEFKNSAPDLYQQFEDIEESLK